jgi:hypothetical protein
MTEFISSKTLTQISVELDNKTLDRLQKGKKVILDVVSSDSEMKNFQVEIWNSDAYDSLEYDE